MKFLVTGFSQFEGVEENPTEWIIDNLPSYLKSRSTKLAEDVCALSVLRVSAKDTELFISGAAANCHKEGSNMKRIMINFGVDVNGDCFKLESRAYNCATFRVPDVDGWQPKECAIEDKGGRTTESFRSCQLPLEGIKDELQTMGHNVQVSEDAGRYICNWTYYHSLMAEHEARLGSCTGETPSGASVAQDIRDDNAAGPWLGLFVHVPSFDITPPEKQIAFVADLLERIQDSEAKLM